MIEIFQINLILLFFSLFLFLPINIYDESNYLKKNDLFDKTALNLAINLNILLVLSFLPISVHYIQTYLYIFFLSIFVLVYKNHLNFIYNFFKTFLPLGLVFIVLSLSISSELYLGYDAKKFYYIKSLFFYEGKTIFDLSNFSQSIWHPHFSSYLWGFFWKLSFLDFEYFGRLFYVFLFCYSFFLISNIGKKSLINIIIFFVLLLLFYEYKYFTGHPEILIFSLLAIISKYLILLSKKNTNNTSFVLLIFLLSNIILWLKSEGTVYFFIILFLLIFLKQITINKKIFIFISFLAAFIFKIFIYKLTGLEEGLKDVYHLEYIMTLDIPSIADKLFKIIIWFVYYSSTNIFLLIFIILIIYEKLYEKKFSLKQANQNFLLFQYSFLILFFITFAYIFRDMEIIQAIRTTMDRLLMTASGFYIYPILFKFLSFYDKNFILRQN